MLEAPTWWVFRGGRAHVDYYMHLSFDVVKQDGFGVRAPFCEEGNTDVVDGYFEFLHKSAFLTISIAEFFFPSFFLLVLFHVQPITKNIIT